MIRKLALAAMVLSLAACETEAPAPPEPPAPVQAGSGLSARIEGTARYHTPAGRAVSCAGLSVVLVGDSPRARGRMLALYGSLDHAVQPAAVVKSRANSLPPPDAPAGVAPCDTTGAFAINGLSPGAYYLIAHVRSAVAARAADDQVVLQKVVVRSGEARQVRLAP